MTEEYVEVELRLNKETMNTLKDMTKKQLRNRICEIALESHIAEQKAEMWNLRCQTALEDVERLEKEILQLESKLSQSENYNEQARSMLEAIMERWYHYDV